MYTYKCIAPKIFNVFRRDSMNRVSHAPHKISKSNITLS